MQKEIIKTKSTNYTVNITNSKVTSLRKVVNTLTTVRAYENGYIGIAGGVGEIDLAELEQQAIANLDNKMTYPCELPENVTKDVDVANAIINPDNFVEICSSIMSRVSLAAPTFMFSNIIVYSELEKYYSNSCNSSLSYKGNSIQVALVLKEKSSANLFDLFYEAEADYIDIDQIVADITDLTANYYIPCDISEGTHKVIFNGFNVVDSAMQHLSCEMYGVGASLFKDSLGKQIFNQDFNLYYNSNPEEQICIPFFDAEGRFGQDYKSYIIKDGILTNLLGNKKVAQKFNLPCAERSSADYDGLAQASHVGMEIGCNNQSLAELAGEEAVLITIASGGDMTSSGDYATPVQLAYLYRNGKIVGRLPNLNISGNIKDIFGKDYIGSTSTLCRRYGKSSYTLALMNVTK
ncbi:MAG: metallopeptidase TldD-related protein [Clostridia bacterium]